MGWADQMIYNPQPVIDTGTVIKGYSKKEVEKIAREAADKTAASWAELADLNWVYAASSKDALDAIIGNRLEPNKKAIRQYVGQRQHKRAEEKNLNLKAAEALFSDDPKVREREKARRGKITEEEKKRSRAMDNKAWGVIIIFVAILCVYLFYPLPL